MYGSDDVIEEAKESVKKANIGSTTPDRKPNRNAFILLKPPSLSGIDIIAPSGKFWIAIPTARDKAAVLGPATPTIDAYAAPTAIPSGMLCIVTASRSFTFLPSPDEGPSWLPPTACMCGMNVSRSNRKKMPSRNPMEVGSQGGIPALSEISIAGISKDQTDAATITPEAKPKRSFSAFSGIPSRKKKTAKEPRVVPTRGMKKAMHFVRIC